MSRLHQPTGHWKIGFALAVFTSLCWGGLPVALKVLLRHVDPITLSWFRFAFAGVVMISWLTARRQLPSFARSNRKLWSLLAVVSLGLTANYIFFQRGIPLTGAGAAQVVIQLSPVMLLVGSVFVFKEQMSRLQWLGLVVTLIGFGVFLSAANMTTQPGMTRRSSPASAIF